jgi:hypothetical protein
LLQTPNNDGVWGDTEFRFDDDSTTQCDWWVVIEDPLERQSAICPANATVLVISEPEDVRRYPPPYIDQFAHVMTCQEYISHRQKHSCPAAGPWHLRGMSYSDLQSSPTKTRSLSVIASNKAFIPGHRARLDFVSRLRTDLADGIDIFGRGINELENKWDGLAPYKFSIAIENAVGKDYWTEKLADCFLAETLPIYFGCPNIADYFPPESYISIDIAKPDEAIQVIQNVVNDGTFDVRLAAIREAKQLVLNRYQTFPLIANYLSSQYRGPLGKGIKHTIRPISYWDSRTIPARVRTRLALVGQSLGLVPKCRY